MFRARPARLDSAGQAERGEMTHGVKCLAMAVRFLPRLPDGASVPGIGMIDAAL